MNFLRKSKSYDMKSETKSKEIDQSLSCTPKNDEQSSFVGRRHLVVFMSFLSYSFINLERLTMSVAIVDMVINTTSNHELHELNRSNIDCPVSTNLQALQKQRSNGGEFDWSSELQGYILSAGFLGYIVSQPPGGRMAELWPTKRMFLLANIITSFSMVVAPFAAWYHAYAMIAVQLTRGLAQGLLVPCGFVIIVNWFPRVERAFVLTLSFSGYSFGAVVGGIITGWICDLPQLGWPYAFYITGGLNLLLCIFFAIYFYETPESHPNISKRELNLIVEDRGTDSSGKKLPLPLWSIFTSVPFYAVIFGLFGVNWAMGYFLAVHPVYMGKVLHLRMTENGILSSLPFLAVTLGSVSSGTLSTWLLKKGYAVVNTLRKGCNTIGSLGFCSCLLAIYFSGCDTVANVAFFSTSLFFIGFAFAGALITCVDMSPTFAGTLMGVVSSVGSLSLVILPVTVGYITEHQTLKEWHQVFFISIAVVFFCTLTFLFFGSAEVQRWNYAEDQDEETADKEKKICE